MSSLPPPPPGPSSAPPPPPPPPYQGQYVPTAPPTSSPKKKTGLIVGALAVVAVLGIGAFVLMKDDGDGNGGASDALPTSAMLVSVQALVTRADVEPAESATLGSCPAGSLAGLAAQGPAAVQAVADVSGEPRAFAYQPDVAGSLALVNCTLDDADYESGIGLAFGEAVDDFRADLIRVLPEFDLTFEPETEHLGGTLLRYCAAPLKPEAGYRPFCETDWFDDNVWVGVFLAADDTTSAITEEWLVTILPGVVAAVTTNALTVETETT